MQERNSHPIPLPAFGGVGSAPSALKEGVPRWDFEYLTSKRQSYSFSTIAYDTRNS